MKRQALIKQFNKVGLVLKITDKPIGLTTNDDVFQMDIGRKVVGTRRTEWFEIWPGHENNKIQILDVDTKLNQILLLVHEPKRIFEIEEAKKRMEGKSIEKSADNRRYELNEQNLDFRETQSHFFIKQQTPADNRRFLMGVDERQLFVAQLIKRVTNIVEARRSLGKTVQFHEGKRKMTPNRQGEWFFVKATDQQEKDIELLLNKKRIFIVKKKNIGKYAGRVGGNPHTADEIVVIPQSRALVEQAKQSKFMRKHKPIVLSEYPVRKREVFVRGRIRHIDHKTIKYTHWYQVILNNEGATEIATQTWID